MGTKTLQEILTPFQLKLVDNLLTEMEKKGLKPIEPKFTAGLKMLLGTWKDELEAKGISSDYLAYVISYQLSQGERG
jgi:hypothetical protein